MVQKKVSDYRFISRERERWRKDKTSKINYTEE